VLFYKKKIQIDILIKKKHKKSSNSIKLRRITNYTDKIYRFIFRKHCKKLFLFATGLGVSESHFNFSAFSVAGIYAIHKGDFEFLKSSRFPSVGLTLGRAYGHVVGT